MIASADAAARRRGGVSSLNLLDGRREQEIDLLVAWPGVGLAAIEVKGGFVRRTANRCSAACPGNGCGGTPVRHVETALADVVDRADDAVELGGWQGYWDDFFAEEQAFYGLVVVGPRALLDEVGGGGVRSRLAQATAWDPR